MSAPVSRVVVTAYRIPTETPESDGTLEWTATTMVVVRLRAGDQEGIGYTYADTAAAQFIREHLSELVAGADPMNVTGVWEHMRAGVRNQGGSGVAATAIAAVDVALWDLKAKLLGVPLVALLGAARTRSGSARESRPTFIFTRLMPCSAQPLSCLHT